MELLPWYLPRYNPQLYNRVSYVFLLILLTRYSMDLRNRLIWKCLTINPDRLSLTAFISLPL